MSLPAVIGNALVMDHYCGLRAGPYEYNGYLYGVFVHSTNYEIQVWRAAIGTPDTWTECDSANEPVAWAGSPEIPVPKDVCVVAEKIHVIYQHAGGAGALGVSIFDMSANTWSTGSFVGGGPVPSDYGTPFADRWKIQVLSNGNYRVAVNMPIGGKQAIKLYNYASATWTALETTVDLSAGGKNAGVFGFVLGDNDDGLIVFGADIKTGLETYMVPVLKTAIAGDYSPGGFFRIAQGSFPSTGPVVRFVNSDSKTVFGCTAIAQARGWDSIAYPGLLSALADHYDGSGRLLPDIRGDYLTSTWGMTEIDDPQGPCCAAVWKAGTLYLVWASINGAFTGIAYASNKGKVWNVPAQAGASGWGFPYGFCAEAISNGIGCFAAASGQTYYFEFAPTSDADACGTTGARYSIQ